MSLDAHLVLRRGQFTVDIELSVPDGAVLGMLGPNGAGKTTALRALAGLEPLTEGHIILDGVDVTAAPPEERDVGVVFQDYLLFPHLTALDNVAYGLRARGMHKAEARADAADWLDQVGLTDRAGYRPRQLSGGQAQRVALARALAPRPRLLLLDEPLAALDAGTRLVLRSDLRRHLVSYGGPAVVVTHDAVEAMVLTDSLVVLEGGRIVQSGAPPEVARHPPTEMAEGVRRDVDAPRDEPVALHRRERAVAPMMSAIGSGIRASASRRARSGRGRSSRSLRSPSPRRR